MDKSLGENRVRIDFNVSNDSTVGEIKKDTASLINKIELLRTSNNGNPVKSEAHRLISLAQTAYEEAAMWAVKAATYK